MTEFGTTAECVLAARNGDREAFGELVRRYRDMAGATAMAVISNRQDAEDAVQEAFIRAYTALGRLQTPEAFGSWLRTAVRRIATDQLRRRYRRSFVENAEGALDILDANSGEDANHDLRDAVNQLPERQREAVLTYYANGFTYERAAEYLGIPMSTLKGRLRQARLRLRRELDPSGLEDMTMGSEKVEKKVSDAVARISTENIETTIPLDVTRNIVFFAGVACDAVVLLRDAGYTGTLINVPEDDVKAVMDSAGVDPMARDKAVVFVADTSDNSLEPVVVSIGVRDWNLTEITDGLKEGQIVLVPPSASIARQFQEYRERYRQWNRLPGQN